MANYIIGKPYSGTITAASAASTMPAANLGKPQPADVWRSTSLTSQYIAIDLGSAQAVNLIALMFTNLTNAATWTIQAGTTDSVSDYTSGSLTAWAGATQNVTSPNAMLFLSSAQTYRYWKISLADAGNGDGYFQAGRVILADVFQGTRNYAYGAGRGFNDLTEKKDSFGGGLLYDVKARRPTVSWEGNWLTAAEMEADILELQRGLDGPVFAMLSPDASTYRQGRMYYGLLTISPVIVSSLNVYSTRFTVEGWPN